MLRCKVAAKRKQQVMEELAQARAQFRSELAGEAAAARWEQMPGRIGVVLSGGGARGAYEAGVLLSFQDAGLPSHVLASTSVGSINAASYAAHSDSLVGNAEPLVKSWSELTPPAVGVDWFRYILVLGGLVAATAGFGNLLRQWMRETGNYFHLQEPKLTWFALGITGVVVLLLYDQLPYLGHALKHTFFRSAWKPDPRKLAQSILANLLLLAFTFFFTLYTHIHLFTTEVVIFDLNWALLAVGGLLVLASAGYFLRYRLSAFSHLFLRLPLRSGLFPNFERTRFLRQRIPADGLRKSPIRVIMTAADVDSGAERCFSNHRREELLADPAVDPLFVAEEVVPCSDPLLGMIASSAYPLVYETVPLEGRTWTDGGIVNNQPIRPAIRMGAEVLFLVLLEPRSQHRGEIKTFLDVGVRAIDILMAQNLKTDLKILSAINAQCEHYARLLGLRPEEITLQVGERSYRFLKAFTIAPEQGLAAAVLDFDGNITAPAILQGYHDGCRAVRSLRGYLAELPSELRRRHVRLVPQESAAAVGRS